MFEAPVKLCAQLRVQNRPFLGEILRFCGKPAHYSAPFCVRSIQSIHLGPGGLGLDRLLAPALPAAFRHRDNRLRFALQPD